MLVKKWINWDPCALLVGMCNVAAAVEDSMAIPQKIKHRNYQIIQQLRF